MYRHCVDDSNESNDENVLGIVRMMFVRVMCKNLVGKIKVREHTSTSRRLKINRLRGSYMTPMPKIWPKINRMQVPGPREGSFGGNAC